MDDNEFSRLHNFLETERENSIEGDETVMTTSTSSSSTLHAVSYSVTSLTEVFNSSSLRDNKPPTPPPRRKRQMEKNKVQKIATRFENIQLHYQNGYKIRFHESFDEEPSSPVSYHSEQIHTEQHTSHSQSTTEDKETFDSVSLDTPLPEGKNKSTVFRFKESYNSLPRPKTDDKIKYNSYHQVETGVDVEVPETPPPDTPAIPATPSTENIEYRPKELIPKEVKPIIDELIKTEQTYVENLKIGLKSYVPLFDRADVPHGLSGKKFVLLGNIEQLLEFHETQFLPMLMKERHDITRLFNEFVRFLDEHYFYSYVIYTMNKKRSLQLCDIYKDYFKKIQDEIGDKLGIMSFLVQPIQRLARYPLLLNTFNAKLFKVSSMQFKSVLAASGKVEKRLKDLCVITNESEQINDIVESNDFNVFFQGQFKKLNDFHCTEKRRGYQSRLFMFDKCVIYTEIASDKRLIFRGCYPCEHIGVIPKPNSFTLFYERRKLQECTFKAEHDVIQHWVCLIQEMIKNYAKEEARLWKNKYGTEKKTSLAAFRNSNRFSSDSGIGDMWVAPKPINDMPESLSPSPRTTWYTPN